MTFSRAVLRLSLGLALAVMAAACGDDATGPPDPPDPPFPSSAGVLMSNFKRAYSEMNWDAYADALCANYRFIFWQDDVEHLGLPNDRLTREEELQVTFNMFNNGGPTPISNIVFTLFEPEAGWVETGPEHPDFPLTWRCFYRLEFKVERPGDATLLILGAQEFFAVSRDSALADGTPAPYWELVGQIDRTVSAGKRKAGESGTWGALKALYR